MTPTAYPPTDPADRDPELLPVAEALIFYDSLAADRDPVLMAVAETTTSQRAIAVWSDVLALIHGRADNPEWSLQCPALIYDALKAEGERAGQWRPIETAPRDGTLVDLHHSEWGRYADCYWGFPHHECGEAGRYCDSEWHGLEEGWVDSTLNEALGASEFTHWMPRPPSPALPTEETDRWAVPPSRRWTAMTDEQTIEVVARAICAEQCAVYGEPACHAHGWPNPNCDEPGCIALAMAACSALKEMENTDG